MNKRLKEMNFEVVGGVTLHMNFGVAICGGRHWWRLWQAATREASDSSQNHLQYSQSSKYASLLLPINPFSRSSMMRSL